MKSKRYFESDLITRLSLTGEGVSSADGTLTAYVARHYGFCHGVVRAIKMALQTVEQVNGHRVYLLNEMIHNPYVNRYLAERGVIFLDGQYQKTPIGLDQVTSSDIVIIPAFGTFATTMERLSQIGCKVVNTTCGEVMSVWKRIGRYNTSDFTTIIHGKFAHEETLATSSRAKRYIVVADLEEAEQIADFIRLPGAGKESRLRQRFRDVASAGFDPQHHLERVGMAAQTTMYADEFLQISALIRDALRSRYGEEHWAEHFLEPDTICRATQERQDAVRDLAQRVDLMIVVGGYNSSNTINLTRVAGEYTTAYHIQSPDKLQAEAITHQAWGTHTEETTPHWIPPGPHVIVGLTSGASTPDTILEETLQWLLSFRGRMSPVRA